MAVLGLQGSGRRGDNNHHRRISRSLQMLGENVTVVDACRTTCCACHLTLILPPSGLGQSYAGWRDWRDAGLRYTSQLDLLPFGQLSIEEQENPQHWQTRLSDICSGLQQLKASRALPVDFN